MPGPHRSHARDPPYHRSRGTPTRHKRVGMMAQVVKSWTAATAKMGDLGELEHVTEGRVESLVR